MCIRSRRSTFSIVRPHVTANAKADINTNMQSAQTSLNVAEKSMAQSDIDAATTQMISSLNNAYADVDTIRTQCDQGIYFYKVTAADKATLDGQKTSLNSSLTGVTALQQSIASLKLALQTAQDQLNVTTAPPTQANIDAAKAQIASAQAQISNAQLMINNATITAPFSGIVRNVVGQVGMVVSPNAPVLSIINNGIMKIDAYASEKRKEYIEKRKAELSAGTAEVKCNKLEHKEEIKQYYQDNRAKVGQYYQKNKIEKLKQAVSQKNPTLRQTPQK